MSTKTHLITAISVAIPINVYMALDQKKRNYCNIFSFLNHMLNC